MVPGRISVLDDSVVNKIAAGEVVERPASVVKELIENSIDAKANRVKVLIVDGGIHTMTVTDDGEGMSRDDAVLALERHATSKIRSADDILDVKTLGFRGEALPSIAAVSRLTMVTRTAESPGGTKVVVEGGRTPIASDHSSAIGTSVTVSDLFYNTPARRKYLKKPSTEARRVTEVVTGEALAHPEVAFSLASNDRQVLFTSGSGDLLQTLGELMGLDTAKSLVKFAAGNPGSSVYGYVSDPSVSRSNRRDLVLVVNGRHVSSSLLTAAVSRAYGTMLPSGRYPVGVVVVDVDPGRIDVNVHPAKTEVRFADEQGLFALITKAVASAVGSSVSRIPHSGTVTVDRNAAGQRGTYIPRELKADSLFAADGPVVVDHRRGSSQVVEARRAELDSDAAPVDLDGLTIVGQLWESYVVASTRESMLLIDQHAAMERLLYDDIAKKLQSDSVDSQEVLLPDTLVLSAAEASAIEENQEILERLGFALEPFGMRTYLIRAVPAILDSDDAADILQDVLSALRDEPAAASADALSRTLVDGLCAHLACKSAVKANHRLSMDEMAGLLEQLFKGASSLYCPHGRPIVATFQRGDIERRVGRK